jgi:hypothetical protein
VNRSSIAVHDATVRDKRATGALAELRPEGNRLGTALARGRYLVDTL